MLRIRTALNSSRQGVAIKTIAALSANSISRRSRGFVLWEIMLALTIFCVVAVALTTAVQQVADASTLLRDESQVRMELQNLLMETAAVKLVPGKSEVQLGDGRVHCEKQIRAVQAKTAAGVALPNLYEIVLKASWTASGQQRSAHAEVIVYRP